MQGVKKVVVTGSNKGIGFAIAEKLAAREGWHVIMAVRNPALGEESRGKILKQFPQAQVSVEKLEVADSKSIDTFVTALSQKYSHVDAFINNAGVYPKNDAFNPEAYKYTFDTNVFGTIELTQKVLPLLADNGKIITLGSGLGPVAFRGITNNKLKEKLRRPDLTSDELVQLAKEYGQGVSDNTYAQKGWTNQLYHVSKLFINVYAKVLGARQDILKRNIQVYACCPGWIQTDMTGHNPAAKPVEQGTVTPLYLFDLPFAVNKELQGQFFQGAKLSTTFE